ncbi:hypothetical protein AWN88_22600 [Agrobacterium tumefaciens]|nr:hypothetical protein AWN88_22600 [Agrobacterium tumefaciens]
MRLRLSRSTSHLGQPWAIEESAMRAILARADEEEKNFSAIAREYGGPIDGAWDGEMHDGIAVLQVQGVLMRQPSFWSWFSGSSVYENILRDAWAAKKAGAKAIIFDIDSPGGEVTGCGELASGIRELSEEIPIYAYVTGNACSAAYWFAAACQKIIISPSSSLGSIGCMATIRDYSAAMDRAGVKEYRFISSQSPLKNADPGTDDGDKAIQATVDALAEVFVSDVADFRRVSRADVLSKFGKGGTFVGQAAVDAGLADALGSLEGLISELANKDSNAVPSATGDKSMGLLKRATAASLKIKAKAKAEEEDQEAEDEEENTSAEDQDENTSAEGDEEDTSAEDEDPEAEDEEDPEAEEEEKPQAKGEKARIAAILGHAEAKGRRKLAEHIALGTNMSVKDAAAMLRAAPKSQPSTSAKGNGFDARMRAQGNPKIGTATGGAGKKNPDAEAAAAVVATAKMLGIAVRN